MRTILVSAFKARCIATLKEVQRTREPVLVTLRGKPLARVVASGGDALQAKRLGALKGSMRIRRDLIRAEASADWDMLK